MDQVRFWCMTVGITVLIWVAVDQSVTTTAEVAVVLKIESAAAANMMISASRKEVMLELRGPKAAMSELNAKAVKPTVRVVLDERDTGNYLIDLADELRRRLDGIPPGLAVVRTTPQQVAVDIDRYVERDVVVRIDSGDVNIVDPQIVPDSIRVVVPERLFEQLPEEDRRLTLHIDAHDSPEGELSIQLPVPAMLHASVPIDRADPREVRFVGRIVGRNETVRLPTVPVRVMFSSKDVNDICARYRVHFSAQADDIVTTELHITGPREVVRAIRDDPRQYGVEGYVVLTREEAFKPREPGEQLLKTPRFILPAGVELAQNPAPLGIELKSLE